LNSTSNSSSKSPSSIVRQRYGEDRSLEFDIDENKNLVTRKQKNASLTKRIRDFSTDIVGYFLPKGYPISVGKGYDKYIQLQAIAMLFSTTGGVLSMQSMLYAVGVGSGSIPLAATLNWIIKDGLGQLGGVLFASIVSNRFDADPKRWRMVASGSMDISSFIELLTPLFPGYFLPLASIANVGKNISFLSASASRAAAHRSFATHENLADITAKAGSQSILCSMLGTGLGIGVATGIASFTDGASDLAYISTIGAFSICSIINLSATYFSLKNVTLTTLNPGRFDYIFDRYLENNGEFLTPQIFANHEYLLGAPNISDLPSLAIGSDLDVAVDNAETLKELFNAFQYEKYIISALVNDSQKTAQVHLLFKRGATGDDIVNALCRVFIVRQRLRRAGYSKTTYSIPQSRTKIRSKGSQGEVLSSKWKTHIEASKDMCVSLRNGKILTEEESRKLVVEFNSKLSTTWEELSSKIPVGKVGKTISMTEMDLGKNSYQEWHVEPIMLESRYARIENIKDNE